MGYSWHWKRGRAAGELSVQKSPTGPDHRRAGFLWLFSLALADFHTRFIGDAKSYLDAQTVLAFAPELPSSPLISLDPPPP